MLRDSKAFSGFAAPDMVKMKEFYSRILDLNVTEKHGLLRAASCWRKQRSHLSEGGSCSGDIHCSQFPRGLCRSSGRRIEQARRAFREV